MKRTISQRGKIKRQAERQTGRQAVRWVFILKLTLISEKKKNQFVFDRLKDECRKIGTSSRGLNSSRQSLIMQIAIKNWISRSKKVFRN